MKSFKFIKINNTKTWEQFVVSLRKVRLWGDKNIYPYKNASIKSKYVDPNEVYPISRYALNGHIEIQKYLHVLLMHQGIDTLNLQETTVDLKYTVDNKRKEWMMSPPIVEESALDGNRPILIDGEHRFLLAKKLNQKIRVAWISNIDSKYPPVAKPLAWDDVKLYETVPTLKYKREYRFQSLKDFPDIASFSKVAINEKTYRYFFYRDLSPVCTTGIRPTGSNTKQKLFPKNSSLI